MNRSRAGSIVLSSFENTATESHILRKRFPQPYTSTHDLIALSNVALNYSWANVTSALKNTGGCSYRWADGQVYPVSYPEGYYSITDLMGFLKNQMKRNKHYLIDENGQERYYLEFVSNPVYYRVTLTTTATPTSLPDGWNNPGTEGNLTGQAPQLIISPAPNKWGELIGFSTGSYPATQGSATQQFNGTMKPVIAPITAVNVSCNWCYDNRFDIHPTNLGTFLPTVAYGATISHTFDNPIYLPVVQNQWPSIEISFYDDQWRPLQILDTSLMQVTLFLKPDL